MYFLLRLVLVLFLAGLQVACAEPKFMDKRVDEVFADPRVVDLVEAAERGDAKGVKAARQAGGDINARGFMDMTPVHWALATKQYDALRVLLEQGADPNQPMEDNWTPTWIAAGAAPPGVLALVLKHGGNPNMVDESLADTPLMHAVSEFRFDNADLLLAYGVDINGHNNIQKDFPADSAATVAIAMGRYDYALKLLERGYSYNLDDLAKTAEIRQVSSNMEPARQAVIRLIEENRQARDSALAPPGG